MKLICDTSYFAIIHWKRLHSCLVTRKGTLLNFVCQTVSVSWFNYLHLGEDFFAEIGLSKNNAVKPRDTDSTEMKKGCWERQKSTAIHQPTGQNRLVDGGPLCVKSCCAVSVRMNHVHTYCRAASGENYSIVLLFLWYAEFCTQNGGVKFKMLSV